MARFTILTLLFFSSLIAHPQEARIIQLPKQSIPLRLEHFHLNSVTDGRNDQSTIGYMLNSNGKRTTLKLAKSTSISIGNFIISNSIPTDISAATELRITELEAITKPAGSGQQLALKMSLAFLINKKQLIEYKVKATDYAKQGKDILDTIELLISKNIIDRLQEFDGWWAKKQGEFIVVDTVQVEATLDDKYIGPMISYARNKPLKLNDFIGKPDPNSPGDAATFSGIMTDYDTKIEDGRLIIIAHITPYFDKYKSWCRPNSRNANTLEHEQHHFDITAIQACDLVQELNNHVFLLGTYKNELQKVFAQKQKDEKESQNVYDEQTSHGRISSVQEEWNKRVKKELKEIPCIK